MGLTLLRNARVFDGRSAEPAEDQDILIEGDTIREVSGSRIAQIPKAFSAIALSSHSPRRSGQVG